MATARLRKTFKYPEDEDADTDERAEMDEEGRLYLLSIFQSRSVDHSICLLCPNLLNLSFYLKLTRPMGISARNLHSYPGHLITFQTLTHRFRTVIYHTNIPPTEQAALLSRLRDQNLTSNETFYPILLALPLLCALPFLYILFVGPSSTTPPTYRLLALLSVTSLIATSVLHGYVSPLSPYSPQNLSKKAAPHTRPSEVFGGSNKAATNASSNDGPLNAYLPLLTRILAGVTALSGLFIFLRGSSSTTTTKVSLEEHFWLWCFVPAIILTSLEVSTRAMADVEKGLEGLRERQYGLKGA